FTFIYVGSYIMHSGLLFFFFLLFSFSLLFLFSIIFRKTLLSVGMTIIVILLGVNWAGDPASAIAPYIPFQYFLVQDIITMEAAHIYENFNITLTNVLLTLVISSVIVLFVVYVNSNVLYKF